MATRSARPSIDNGSPARNNTGPGGRVIQVHAWKPNANSGKPLLCLDEKGVPLVHC